MGWTARRSAPWGRRCWPSSRVAAPAFSFSGRPPASASWSTIRSRPRQFPAENHLSAWSVTTSDGTVADGAFLPAFPRVVNDLQFLAAPALADIDGDGLPEAIEGSGVYDVHAVNANGVEASGWPKFTNGWMVGTPAVGDVDGDGRLEVVGVTREGWLFVWRTAGDECGDIPWRRWHHDEWGTGNYGTDARPPAAIAGAAVGVERLGPTQARLDLPAMPGDDLYCGSAGYDVRFADTPIEDAEAFAAASPIDSVTANPQGSRKPGSVTVEDERLRDRSFYLAFTAVDDAGNRSPLVSLGPLDLTIATPTATPTLTPLPTATPTEPLATETPTSVPTPTARPAMGEDDGCNVSGRPATGAFPWWLLGLVALVVGRKNSSRGLGC